MGIAQSGSILSMLRSGAPINVDVGTFGGQGSVFADDWVDRFDVRTVDTSRVLFKEPAGQGTKTFADSNTPAAQVPGGQRWDLMGMFFGFQKVSGAAITAAEKAAFVAWVQSMRISVSFGSNLVFSQPLWAKFGSQLAQETAVTPTLALQSALPKPVTWGEFWPEECHLPLAANVVLDVKLEFAPPDAAIAVAAGVTPTFRFAAWFPRVVAYQS